VDSVYFVISERMAYNCYGTTTCSSVSRCYNGIILLHMSLNCCVE